MESMILLSILVILFKFYICSKIYVTSSLKFKRVFSLIAILAIVFSTLGQTLNAQQAHAANGLHKATLVKSD